MEDSELLLTVAQVSVAFAGFSGLATGGGDSIHVGLDELDSFSLSVGDMSVDASNLVALDIGYTEALSLNALAYQGAFLPTPTSTAGPIFNFPLTISGTDLASGLAFEYTWASSAQTLELVPEPSTALLLIFGLVALAVRHRVA